MGGLLHLVQRAGDWAWRWLAVCPSPTQSRTWPFSAARMLCFYVDTDVKQEAQLSLTNCAMLFCKVVEDFLPEYVDKKLTTDDNVA